MISLVERNQLVAELQATNAKLEETNRLKNAFLEVASHELNTPVTVVLGLSDLWKLLSGHRRGRTATTVGRTHQHRGPASGQNGRPNAQTS